MVKNILVCIDRDGTLIYDNKFHLGHQRKWKRKVEVLPTVISGLKLLNKIPNIKIYMITNQPGVSVENFFELTIEKAREVCKYVLRVLEKRGGKINGFEICGKASTSWAKKHPEFKFLKKNVGNFSCFKPNPGMVNSILKKEGWDKINTKVYTIGDRVVDVKLAKHFKGYGIKINFKNRLEEDVKFENLKMIRKYSAKNFLDASKFILKKELK